MIPTDAPINCYTADDYYIGMFAFSPRTMDKYNGKPGNEELKYIKDFSNYFVY